MLKRKDFSWKLFLSVLLIFMFFLVMGQILVNYVFGFLEPNNFNTTASDFTILILKLIFLAFVAFAIMRTKRISYFQSLEFLGFKKPDHYQIAVGLICSAPIIFCDYLAFKNGLATGYQASIRTDWLIKIILIFLGAGLFEEGLMRGFFFHYLRQKHTFLSAAAFSGILWGLSHIDFLFSDSWLGLSTDKKIFYFFELMCFLFLLSFPSAYIFERSGNIIWGWLIVHVVYDSQIILGLSGYGETIIVAQTIYPKIGAILSVLVAFPVAHWLLKKPTKKRKRELKIIFLT